MSRWTTAADRNRRMVADNAERILNDTSYDRLRTPSALRRIVVAYVVASLAVPVCWLWSGSIAGVGSVLVATGCYLLLRVAVRSVADMPDHVLDERLRRDRDSVYLDAFRWVSALVFVAANVALAAVAFSDEGASITFDYDDVSAVYWSLLAAIMGGPSVVLALRQAHSDAGVESARPTDHR